MGIFDFGSGSRSAARVERQLQVGRQQIAERFDELREQQRATFEESLGRLQALRNPFLAQLTGAATGATARRLASVSAQARVGGGPRTGRTFGLARADIAQRLGGAAGLEAAVLRLQGMQAAAGLEESRIGAERGFIGQEATLSAALRNQMLAGEFGLRGAGVAGIAQVSSAGIGAGAANFGAILGLAGRGGGGGGSGGGGAAFGLPFEFA
jgi:hypothetical protein